jgi:hypothetical protein
MNSISILLKEDRLKSQLNLITMLKKIIKLLTRFLKSVILISKKNLDLKKKKKQTHKLFL